MDLTTDKLLEKIRVLSENIQKLLRIGAALSSERELDKLLEVIIEEAKFFTSADGGTLYLKTKDEKFLEFVVAQNDTLNIKMGGNGEKITWPKLNLYKEDGSENLEMVAVVSALKNKIINIIDVYNADGFNFEGTKRFDNSTGYRSKSMLVIPMQDHEGEVIGVMQLINKKENGNIVSFNNHDEHITLSLASQAAVAITNTILIQDLENLLESFLDSIAVAIDEKSPYTGGHIRKVVKISEMLSLEINKDKEIFKNISFSENELKQIKLAALMHDIGKITTPEYIVDKATKLETIFDRIEFVKAKAEILKRDAKIEFLNKKIALLENKSSEEEIKRLEEEYKNKILQIKEQVKVIESANFGKEYTTDEVIEKINKIAKQKLIIDDKEHFLLSDDETYNLSVRKGTITEEQRQIINNHAAVSLRMLKSLPFPKKYKRVPEIAGGHHEKLNGKGYPLGLKGDELAFETRLLAVADIFEALPASDRQYKKALKLSQAMKILYFMVKDGELDKDIVKFFYEKKLYMKYAKEELKEENIDDIELDFSTE